MTTSCINIVQYAVLLLLASQGPPHNDAQQKQQKEGINTKYFDNRSMIAPLPGRQQQPELHINSFTLAPEFSPSTVTSICYHLSRRTKQLKYMKPKYVYKLSILILSGDIALNPGPVKFPCILCKRAVAKNHRAVQCDECDNWVHIKCAGITPAYYNQLQENDDPWFCHTHTKLQTDIKQPNPQISDSIPKTCTETFQHINDSFVHLEDEDNEWTDIPNPNSETEPNTHASTCESTPSSENINDTHLNSSNDTSDSHDSSV